MRANGLEITHLTCRLGRIALEDVSLRVPEGGCLAVLGAPGSGKTALMRTLAGFARPLAGAVTFEGTRLGDKPPHRRGFGVVRQPDALFPGWTLAANIALPLRLRRVRRRDRARLLDAILDVTQLTEAAGLLPGQATPAQRRLALLARAAVFGPRLLLLDDPSGTLDEAGVAAMTAAISRIHATLGGTILLATRRAAEALALAGTIAVLAHGRLAQLATAEEFCDRPATPDAAMLLGETNFLPGTLAEVEDDTATVRLACGPLAQGRPAVPLSLGEACVLGISPARIALAAARPEDMGDGALPATIVESLSLGETIRFRLLLGSGAALVVSRPAAAGSRGLTPGLAVAVAWQPHHAPIFRAPLFPAPPR